jgi:hypothetical protein
MSDPRNTMAAGAAIPLRRRSLAPERLPQFPPRSAADPAPVATGPWAHVAPPRRRGRLALGLAMAVLAAAAGAGGLVALDPLSPPDEDELAKLVASAEPPPSPLPGAAPQVEAAPTVVHTGALVTRPPDPVVASPPAPDPVVAPAPQPPDPESPSVAESAPAAIASLQPEPEAARERGVSTHPAPQTQANPSATRSARLEPAELNALVSKGEQFLKAGDLASARLFFGRAANAGDSRGAYGMARSYDPAVVRKLPVYGLAVDAAEAEGWYAKGRALDSGKVLAQP